mgnify:CR=1 FL=1
MPPHAEARNKATATRNYIDMQKYTKILNNSVAIYPKIDMAQNQNQQKDDGHIHQHVFTLRNNASWPAPASVSTDNGKDIASHEMTRRLIHLH